MAHGQAATPGQPPYAPGPAGLSQSGARPSAEGTAPAGCVSGVPVVQALQEFVSCELDFLVAPFGCPVLACDDAHAVDAAEVSVDERVPGLGVVAGPLGEPEVPLGVFLPRV